MLESIEKAIDFEFFCWWAGSADASVVTDTLCVGGKFSTRVLRENVLRAGAPTTGHKLLDLIMKKVVAVTSIVGTLI